VVNGALPVKSDVTNLALDVPSFEVSGTLTVNGKPPTGICTTKSATTATVMGILYFSSEPDKISAVAPIFCNPGQAPTFSTTLLPSDYAIALSNADATTNLPNFFGQPVMSKLHVASPISGLALDTSAVLLSGTITLNGRQPDKTCTNSPVVLSFGNTTNRARGEIAVPCVPGPLSFSVAAPPGTYRVTIVGQDSGFPLAGYTLPTPMTVTKDQTGIVWDVPTRQIAGTLTIRGMKPTGSCTAGANVGTIVFARAESLRNGAFFVPLLCAQDGSLTFTETVFPGTYAIGWGGSYRLNLPRSSGYRLASGLAVP
jgi:hypothetical protein